MSRIWYDTEFIEDGRTIELISIGMVREADGAELYLVNRDAPWDRIARHPWLCEHVVPHLPLTAPVRRYDDTRRTFVLDVDDPRVVSRTEIADQILAFIRGAGPNPLLRAWFGAFDHVVLSWLWGAMDQHPDGVPMWTGDVKQDHVRLGEPALPAQTSGLHDALADARQVQEWDLLLDRIERGEGARR
jgi:hypothetical protein